MTGRAISRRISGETSVGPGVNRMRWSGFSGAMLARPPPRRVASVEEILGDVEIDDGSHEQKKEDESRLHHALLDRGRQVAAQRALDRQREEVPAVERGDREQVDDPELQADERDQLQERDQPLLGRLAREAVQVDRAGERLERQLAADQLA